MQKKLGFQKKEDDLVLDLDLDLSDSESNIKFDYSEEYDYDKDIFDESMESFDRRKLRSWMNKGLFR